MRRGVLKTPLKIQEKMKYIDNPIDIKIMYLGKKGDFYNYRIMPDIITQNSNEMGSLIRDE